MKNMYLRILSIRKHKTITFVSAYSNQFGIVQYMINNELSKNINCGDIIDCNIKNDINKRGNQIKRITDINRIIKCSNFPSYKGVNNTIDNEELNDFLNARNCGSQLNLLRFKRELLINIQNILNNLNYFDATGLLNQVENYSNGSNIVDAIIQDRNFNQPRFLRVTMEHQLKQMTSTLLQSTYAIEKVYRNMSEDASHINEFLMLELVSVDSTMHKMLEFIKGLDNLVKTIGDKYDIMVPNKDLQIVDFRELNPNTYEKTRKNFTNTIVLNFPCESPFILKDENDQRKEVRWYINGHWICHYYEDEYRYQNIKEVLEKQKELLNKNCINPMLYYEWGLLPTISLGLSIDRWMQMLIDKNHISSVANPLVLDYKRRWK